MLRHVIRTVAFAAVLSAPAVATAQRASSPSTAARAREALDLGRQYIAEGQWQLALEALTRSYDLVPTNAALVDIDACLDALGLDRTEHGPTASMVREFAGAPAPVAPGAVTPGHVTIIVSVAGAEVRVDGRLAGRSPLDAPLELPAGLHVVEARRADRPIVERRFELSSGEARDVWLDLGPPRASQRGPRPARAARSTGGAR